MVRKGWKTKACTLTARNSGPVGQRTRENHTHLRLAHPFLSGSPCSSVWLTFNEFTYLRLAQPFTFHYLMVRTLAWESWLALPVAGAGGEDTVLAEGVADILYI